MSVIAACTLLISSSLFSSNSVISRVNPTQSEYFVGITTKEQKLVGLIQKMVSPYSWEDSEGEGKIEMVEQILIVRQRGPELNKVGNLLKLLEKQLAEQRAKQK